MASTYDNDLRLNEMATGDQSGAWGTVTNLNLEMIAEAFSYGTRAIANASTDNITLADGALDADRSMYLKLTGGGQACTVSLLPNTVSKVWLIENATSHTLTFTQGSGANVAVLAGQVKMIATDGAGSGAVVYDLLTDVNLAGTTVTDNLTVSGNIDLEGNIDVNGTTNLDAVDVDGAVQIDATVNVGVDDTGYDVKFFGDTASAYMQWDASADDLILGGAAGLVVPDGKLTLGSTAVTSTGAELNILDGVTSTATEINQLDAITRGSILYGNASGATARLAKGAAGTVLTSDGTDLSFAAVQAGASRVVWPSDFASPTNTYTSSGTWSKGSLADTDYVWVYLVGGGGAGGYASNGYSVGGAGGSALLLYGQAQWFNGGAYVIGAGGGFGNAAANSNSTATTFTFSSSNNSTAFTTGTDGGSTQSQTGVNIFKQIEDKTSPITIGGQVLAARISPTSTFILPDTPPTVPNANGADTLYNAQVSPNQGGYSSAPYNSVFAGGGGEGAYAGNGSTRGGSLYGGRGAAYASGTAGAVPGGGGASGTSTSNRSDGGAGNVRVYHV